MLIGRFRESYLQMPLELRLVLSGDQSCCGHWSSEVTDFAFDSAASPGACHFLHSYGGSGVPEGATGDVHDSYPGAYPLLRQEPVG